MSSDQSKCCECGRAVSYETGFTMTGGLGDASEDRLYCPDCAPDTSKGYTLSDMEKWREENQVHRAAYEMSMMDLVGPDVYFAIKGAKPTPRQRYERMLRGVVDQLGGLTFEYCNWCGGCLPPWHECGRFR